MISVACESTTTMSLVSISRNTPCCPARLVTAHAPDPMPRMIWCPFLPNRFCFFAHLLCATTRIHHPGPCSLLSHPARLWYGSTTTRFRRAERLHPRLVWAGGELCPCQANVAVSAFGLIQWFSMTSRPPDPAASWQMIALTSIVDSLLTINSWTPLICCTSLPRACAELDPARLSPSPPEWPPTASQGTQDNSQRHPFTPRGLPFVAHHEISPP